MSVRAADILAERLYEAGCRHAFGIPGGEVLTIVDALRKAGIEFVLTKHENSAGFLAEGVFHRTKAPGILVATIGPGVVNAVNVVANAEQERIPLIVLTGCVDDEDAHTYTHQVLNHQAVFEPVSKATFRLSAIGAGVIADKAVAIATDPRCGPVHIDIPISVADEDCGPNVKRPRRASAPQVVPVDGLELESARQFLKHARKPVLIAGLDAVFDDAGKEITELAERFNVPVITTYKAKGLIPETNYHSLGAAGLSPLADELLLPFVRSADLIICAGYDPIEMRTGWRDVWDPNSVNVVDISPLPNRHYMHQGTINFIANTATTLARLAEGIVPNETWVDGELDALKGAQALQNATEEEWGPAALIQECRKVLPKNTIATADSGAHRIMLSQMWQCYEPRSLLQSSALCTMGCAVPLAIGAKIADRERPVVSFSGDAGMLMVLGELATAAELGQNTIFVVFVDSSLALIELKQRQRQLPNSAVDFGLHDYAAIAQAMGGCGHTVKSRAELRDAMKSALAAPNFSLIAAQIDRRSYDGNI